jgi:poly [ADP-ribose] polymerase
MYPLEMDYGQDAENIKKLDLTKSKSKLDKKVQELITTIFDIESMKKAMIEFEIDMTKMPMGKISKKTN